MIECAEMYCEDVDGIYNTYYGSMYSFVYPIYESDNNSKPNVKNKFFAFIKKIKDKFIDFLTGHKVDSVIKKAKGKKNKSIYTNYKPSLRELNKEKLKALQNAKSKADIDFIMSTYNTERARISKDRAKKAKTLITVAALGTLGGVAIANHKKLLSTAETIASKSSTTNSNASDTKSTSTNTSTTKSTTTKVDNDADVKEYAEKAMSKIITNDNKDTIDVVNDTINAVNEESSTNTSNTTSHDDTTNNNNTTKSTDKNNDTQSVSSDFFKKNKTRCNSLINSVKVYYNPYSPNKKKRNGFMVDKYNTRRNICYLLELAAEDKNMNYKDTIAIITKLLKIGADQCTISTFCNSSAKTLPSSVDIENATDFMLGTPTDNGNLSKKNIQIFMHKYNVADK